MSEKREHLQCIFNAAIEAVSPDRAVKNHLLLQDDILVCGTKKYNLKEIDNIYILGAGKGAAPMVLAIESILGDRIAKGLVCVKYDHNLPATKVTIAEASHPLPDENGQKITNQMLQIADEATERDLIICLFTGGASALTPALMKGISLYDAQALTNQLLSSGSSIDEINNVRKHISSFSGGKIALAAAPASVLSLIVSDVIGDDLSIIASGPTCPDPSTYLDSIQIIEKYKVTAPFSITNHLIKGMKGEIDETPKGDNPALANVYNQLIATNRQAINAANSEARKIGYKVNVIGDAIEGEACTVARELVDRAKRETGPLCLIGGGETTVTLKGHGLGGRNQEMALAASLALETIERKNIHCLFAGTDGTDGPTDAAGGFACPVTLSEMKRKNIVGLEYLTNNDAYHFLEKTQSLLITGPTRTNVMDLVIILID